MKRLKTTVKYFFITLGLFVFVLLILGQTDLGNKYKETDPTEATFVKIGDNTIRYLQKGTGKDILLIHGSPGSIEDWQPIIDTLAKKYRVTAFDRLGHGYSTNIQHDYHINSNATVVKQLIKKLNLKSPMIVGHSYGGSIVANLVATSGKFSSDTLQRYIKLYYYRFSFV